MGTNIGAGNVGLQAAVVPGSSFTVPEIFAANRDSIIPRVCRIEMMSAAVTPEPEPLGTGFIVGEYAVLTNSHVIEEARRRGGADRLRCRFDYAELAGGMVRHGRDVEVTRIVMESGCSPAELTINPDVPPPTADELDFALLLLGEPVGADRGIISLPMVQTKVGINERLYIAQHPEGGPIKFADDQPGVIDLFHSERRLRYRTRTERGSSGSPVFNSTWKIVALHHLGDPKYKIAGAADYNQGIPIALIVKSIVAAGHGALIAPLEDDLELADDRKGKLVFEIGENFVLTDYIGVLQRYVGQIGKSEIMPSGDVREGTSLSIYEKARKQRLLREFLGRVLEQKWSVAKLRNEVLVSVGNLARPANDFDRRLADIAAGFDVLLSRIADDDLVRAVGPHIPTLWVLADHLGRLSLLKRLHEALRNLQVQSADWLAMEDPTPETMADLPPGKLAEIMQRVSAVAKEAQQLVSQPHVADFDTQQLADPHAGSLKKINELGTACMVVLEPAAFRFSSAVHAGTQAALDDLADVRKLLAGDSGANPPTPGALRAVASLIFGICRDLPLKTLRQAFRDAEVVEGSGRDALRMAGRATVDLSDALRRRAVEQELWQEIDGWLHEADLRISAAPQDFNPVQALLMQLFSQIKQNVARLGANGADGRQISDACQEALHDYRSNLGTMKKDHDMLRKAVESSFADLALVARARTHDVDRAFLADSARLPLIGAKILAIYRDIGLTWSLR